MCKLYSILAILLFTAACSIAEDVSPPATTQTIVNTATETLPPTHTLSPSPTQTLAIRPTDYGYDPPPWKSLPTPSSTPEFSLDIEGFAGRYPTGLDWILASEDKMRNLTSLSLALTSEQQRWLSGSSFSGKTVVLQDCILRLPLDSYCQSQTTSYSLHFFTQGIRGEVTTNTETVILAPNVWFKSPDEKWEQLSGNVTEALGLTEEGLEHLLFSQFVINAELKGQKLVGGKTLVGIFFQVDIAKYYEATFGIDSTIDEELTNDNWLWIDIENLRWHSSFINLVFYEPVENDRQFVHHVNAYAEYSDFDIPVVIPEP